MVLIVGSKEARTRWRALLDAVQSGSDVLIERSGQRVAVMLPYDDYENIREYVEDMRADRRAIDAYEAWQSDSSGAIPWDEFEAELIAEGLLDAEPLDDTDRT